LAGGRSFEDLEKLFCKKEEDAKNARTARARTRDEATTARDCGCALSFGLGGVLCGGIIVHR
jgi:hypothetical protein